MYPDKANSSTPELLTTYCESNPVRADGRQTRSNSVDSRIGRTSDISISVLSTNACLRQSRRRTGSPFEDNVAEGGQHMSKASTVFFALTLVCIIRSTTFGQTARPQ